jgi:hypothetical protein
MDAVGAVKAAHQVVPLLVSADHRFDFHVGVHLDGIQAIDVGGIGHGDMVTR